MVVVDICNTLSDINGQLDKLFGKCDTYPNKAIPSDFFEKNPWIFAEAEAYADSARVLREIAKREEILYLSARPLSSLLITKNWLFKKNLFPKGLVVFYSGNKAMFLKEHGIKCTVAYEDAPKEIEGYLNCGIKVFAKSQPYNQQYTDQLFNNWSELA